MPEEPEPEALAFVRPFYDSRDICHDEGFLVAVAHHPELWLHRGEWLIGNLRFRSGQYREEGGLACIGEAYKADVRKYLQFKDEPPFYEQ